MHLCVVGSLGELEAYTYLCMLLVASVGELDECISVCLVGRIRWMWSVLLIAANVRTISAYRRYV